MTTLNSFANQSYTAEILEAHGVSKEVSTAKATLFAEAAQLLQDNGVDGSCAAHAFFIPGRVEVLGKHTDYAGGRSLIMAISKAFCVLTVDRNDNTCRFFSTEKPGDHLSVEMGPDTKPVVGHWTNYPATAVRRLSANFSEGGLKGVDMAIACDIPLASGLSTSSAIICGVWLALNARNNFEERQAYKDNIHSPEDLMEYLGCNENGQNFKGLLGDKGVGTFGGSEDHTAIMSCTAGNMHLYSYCPTKKEGVYACPPGMCFVIGVSGAIAEKTGDKMKDYNDAAMLAREAARTYCEGTGSNLSPLHLANVIKAAGSADAVEAGIRKYFASGGACEFSEEALLIRFRQFHAESEEIIPAFAAALTKGDTEPLSALVDRSQELTDSHLKNQVPETVFLAKSARDLGACAASAFGAGFGGSVWALVEADTADTFMGEWQSRYTQHYPTAAVRASFFKDIPGPGAFCLTKN